MSTKTVTTTYSTNTLSLLGVAFVVLKLTGHIDWSWWWVTLPFWAVFACFLIGILVGLLFAGVAWLVEKNSQ